MLLSQQKRTVAKNFNKDAFSAWDSYATKNAPGTGHVSNATVISYTRNHWLGKPRTQMPEFPLEILFEICLHLAPPDLVSITSANRIVCRSLLAKNAAYVWEVSRKQAKMPPPPSGYTESYWVQLVFGKACQDCGSRTNKINFTFMKRLCVKCYNKQITTRRSLEKYDDTFDEDFYEDFELSWLYLVPYSSYRKLGTDGHPCKHFWVDDLYRIAKEIKCFTPGTAKHREYTREQRAHVEERHKFAEVCKGWTTRYEKMREAELDDARKRLLLYVVWLRFYELGYERADAEKIQWEDDAYVGLDGVQHAWPSLRAKYEDQFYAVRRNRILSTRLDLVRQRQQSLAQVYSSYRASLPSFEWIQLPHVDTLLHFPQIQQMLFSGTATVVTAESFTPPFRTLLTDIRKMMALRRDHLQQHLSEWPTKPQSLVGLHSKVRQATSDVAIPACPFGRFDGVGKTDLALAIFRCIRTRVTKRDTTDAVIKCKQGRDMPLFGHDGAARHHCIGASSDQDSLAEANYDSISTRFDSFEFDSYSSRIVLELISLLGLDPMTTTVHDMDNVNARFICISCRRTDDEISPGRRRVYNWRAAVAHADRCLFNEPRHVSDYYSRETMCKFSSFRRWFAVLADNVAAEVKSSEYDSEIAIMEWTCMRCPLYLDNPQEKLVIIKHLEKCHGVPSPRVGDDLALGPFKQMPCHSTAQVSVRTIFDPRPARSTKGYLKLS